MSLLLFGNNLFVGNLRALSSAELFLNASYYGKHPLFVSLSEQHNKSESHFFTMSIKNATIDSDLKNEAAVRYEALLNCKDKEWSSFLCILALSTVVCRKIVTLFPDCGDAMQKVLRSSMIFPRQECVSDTPLYILHCKLDRLLQIPKNFFQINHFVPLIKLFSSKRKCASSSVSKRKKVEAPSTKKSSVTKAKAILVKNAPNQLPINNFFPKSKCFMVQETSSQNNVSGQSIVGLSKPTFSFNNDISSSSNKYSFICNKSSYNLPLCNSNLKVNVNSNSKSSMNVSSLNINQLNSFSSQDDTLQVSAQVGNCNNTNMKSVCHTQQPSCISSSSNIVSSSILPSHSANFSGNVVNTKFFSINTEPTNKVSSSILNPSNNSSSPSLSDNVLVSTKSDGGIYSKHKTNDSFESHVIYKSSDIVTTSDQQVIASAKVDNFLPQQNVFTASILSVGKSSCETNVIPMSHTSTSLLSSSSPIMFTGNVSALSTAYESIPSGTIHGKYDVEVFKKYINKRLSDEDKYKFIKNVFVPDKTYKFPKCPNTNRSFLYNWLENNDWLCYSPSGRGAYCLPCILFVGDKKTQAKSFIFKAFQYWPDASGAFKRHADPSDGIHAKCKLEFELFLSQMEGKSERIDVSLCNLKREKVITNRRVLLALIDAVMLCGRLNISLRGHRDDSRYHPEIGSSTSKPGVGKFVNIINYAIRNGNTDLKNHLKNASKRSTYMSKTTQNDLLKCCSEVFTDLFVSEIKANKFFSLILDEATDVSNKAQLSFCLRFVDANGDVREEFLKFVHCEDGVTGADLFRVVAKTLDELGLDLGDCRGQGYDGAGGMAGEINGLSGNVLRENPKAIYSHCQNHRLNLVIASLTKIIGFRNVMDAIKSISYFFNLSPKRQRHLEKLIGDHFPEKKRKKLLDVCRTRWLERIDGVDLFEDLFSAIVMTLEDICNASAKSFNKDTVSKANSLFKLIYNFDFVVKLVVCRHVLDLTSDVTRLLQSKTNDIVKGLDLIKTLLNVFELIRVDIQNKHSIWYKEALEIATSVNLDESKPRSCFRMTLKENHPSNNVSEFYKRSFTIPLIDEVRGEVSRRFTGDNSIVFKGLFVIPEIMISSKSDLSLNWRSEFLCFLDFYKDDFNQVSFKTVEAELDLWEEHWNNPKTTLPDSVSSTLKCISFTCFPIIKTALRILGTIPVTSCSCERSFSALRKLKDYNRSTMCNDRLTALALIYIHQEVDPDPLTILRKFVNLKPHRLQFDL